MASAAYAMNQHRPKRRGKPSLAYQTIGGKPLPKEQGQALVMLASQRMRDREEETARQRQSTPERQPSPLARSLQRLTDEIEAKLVEATWTERCLPNGGSGGRCGIPYMHDKAEIFANAVAAGDWQQKEYGSPPPKAIDAMRDTLAWLSILDRDNAGLVHAAAGSKRGEPKSNVSWGEVKSRLPQFSDFPVRSLQRRYEEALETIMVKVTFG